MRFPFLLAKKPSGDFTIHPPAKLNLKSVVGLVVAVLILVTATAAAFRSRRATPVAKVAAASSSKQTPVLETPGKRTMEALPIQLKPGGFVPREITLPEGDYLFSVNNQSGVAEVNLRLERERGETLHESRVKGERLRWRQEAHLAPGTYLITEADHPEWVCRILINSK